MEVQWFSSIVVRARRRALVSCVAFLVLFVVLVVVVVEAFLVRDS